MLPFQPFFLLQYHGKGIESSSPVNLIFVDPVIHIGEPHCTCFSPESWETSIFLFGTVHIEIRTFHQANSHDEPCLYVRSWYLGKTHVEICFFTTLLKFQFLVVCSHGYGSKLKTWQATKWVVLSSINHPFLEVPNDLTNSQISLEWDSSLHLLHFGAKCW